MNKTVFFVFGFFVAVFMVILFFLWASNSIDRRVCRFEHIPVFEDGDDYQTFPDDMIFDVTDIYYTKTNGISGTKVKENKKNPQIGKYYTYETKQHHVIRWNDTGQAFIRVRNSEGEFVSTTIGRCYELHY